MFIALSHWYESEALGSLVSATLSIIGYFGPPLGYPVFVRCPRDSAVLDL